MKTVFFNASILKTGTVGAALAMLSSCGPDGTARAPASTDEPAALETVAQVEDTSDEGEDTPLRTTNRIRLTKPPAPANFTAAAGRNGPILRWEPAARAKEYMVWRAPVPKTYRRESQIKFSRIATTTKLDHTDAPAKAGVDFIYRVTASNGAGASNPSNTSCSWKPEASDTGPFAGVRPKVYLSIHGATNLAKGTAAQQQQWAYVRMCLDGFYGNQAGATEREIANLIKLTNTRNYVGIVNLNDFMTTKQSPNSLSPKPKKIRTQLRSVDSTAKVENAFPLVRLQRGPMVGYSVFPEVWNRVSLQDMVKKYVNNIRVKDKGNRYSSIYTGSALKNWIRPFTKRTLAPNPDPRSEQSGQLHLLPNMAKSNSARFFEGAAGHMVECIGGLCAGGGKNGMAFDRAVSNVRNANINLLLFLSHQDGSKRTWNVNMRKIYNKVNGRRKGKGWQSDDIIMLVNYRDNYPLLPEKTPSGDPANTLTGNLYWLLHR